MKEFVFEEKRGKFQGQSSKVWSNRKTFVDAIRNSKGETSKGEEVLAENTVQFTTEKEELSRYWKAFIGVIKEPKLVVKLKHFFHEEGLLAIRLTILGLNMCILEDLVSGEVENFILDRKPWWEQWFTTIRPWQPDDVDSERLLWLRVRGIPCHAWSKNFFTMLVKSKGSYTKSDDTTLARTSIEEARVCIKSHRKEMIKFITKAFIDG